VSDVLSHVGQCRPLLQRDHILRRQHLGSTAGRGDEPLVELDQERHRAVQAQLVPAAAQQFLGGAVGQCADDAGRKLDAAEAGALAHLLDDIGQPADALAALVAAQGVAGPLEGPVRVDLPQDVIFVSASQAGWQTGNGRQIARSTHLAVSAERGMPQVGNKADGRQRLTAARNLQRPLQSRLDRGRARRDGPLQPQALEQVALCQFGIAEDGDVHWMRPGAHNGCFVLERAYVLAMQAFPFIARRRFVRLSPPNLTRFFNFSRPL
jgi:hypothetical protein